MRRGFTLLVVVIAAAALLGACGSSDSSDKSETTTTEAKSLEVTKVWARTSASVQTAGAVYMTIANGMSEDEALTKASVPSSIAETVELHETTSGMSSSTTSGSMESTTTTAMGSSDSMGNGQMSMQPVSQIDIPAGKTVELKPGGYHIMLMKLAAPLTKGQTFPVTLTFSKAGEKTVTATVSDTAP